MTDIENLYGALLRQPTDSTVLVPATPSQTRLAAPQLSSLKVRLGMVNVFNPFWADGMVELDLHEEEGRMLVRLYMDLAEEPGENWIDEEFNGNRFEIGVGWRQLVPDRGHLLARYHTGLGSADVAIRCGLARRLLMPGKGRYICAPERAFGSLEEAEEVDGTHPLIEDCEWDREDDWHVGVDGQLVRSSN